MASKKKAMGRPRKNPWDQELLHGFIESGIKDAMQKMQRSDENHLREILNKMDETRASIDILLGQIKRLTTSDKIDNTHIVFAMRRLLKTDDDDY